ncbi:hypothetical protein E2C01_077657 [Portunus trituberculatus]|uniref:Uncharacterized protein n=1 Tax=Portunus trituberculatus TaxID=210409 RepID=A0A5B7IQA5_PORTR|nr:hypothetical protein [Portunus trituberculatus]
MHQDKGHTPTGSALRSGTHWVADTGYRKHLRSRVTAMEGRRVREDGYEDTRACHLHWEALHG